MAKVKLTRNRLTGPVITRLGGKGYALTHDEFVEMPLWSAVSLLGDEGLMIEFTAKDEKAITNLNELSLRVLGDEFGVEHDAKKIKKVMFPKTRKPKKKAKPVEKPIVEEPPIEIESEEE
jgi:hypothetical protein|tara:strand:- start:8282 stop:8641 length:360 start_codon:yes stop_codon:yes gene_type:complete